MAAWTTSKEKLSKELHYIPLPKNVSDVVVKAVNAIGSGGAA